MRYELKNEKIFAEIDSHGAELVRLVFQNEEILYQKHPDFWQRQSPVLFPIVGGLKEKKYKYDHKEFSLNQHGFARDQEFELIEKTNSLLVFLLDSNGRFLENYPFEFSLIIRYILTESALEVQYEVVNKDDKTMYYSIGGHPAFAIKTPVKEYSIDFKNDMRDFPVSRIHPTEFLLDKNFSEKFPVSSN